MMNTKTEGNTFTKKIGQTVYVVRYYFNEDAKETLQEKNCCQTDGSFSFSASIQEVIKS